MSDYKPQEIEPRWQSFWEANQTFRTEDDFARPKFYVLDMFPYPSGSGLHVGHCEGYTATDIVARYKKAMGFNVLHPMGWDAFGLPAEQYALETGTHPADTTAKNIATFKGQLRRLGFNYDWDREINTTDVEYYRWTQWLFLKLYERDLAYMAEVPVNWCPALGTVLANEEVKDGKSERGSFPVIRKPMRQWMLRITQYADRLLEDLDLLDWPEYLKEMQRNWIGRSLGAEVDFKLDSKTANGVEGNIRVFTTRPDTLFGATYMVLAPEHALVDEITAAGQLDAVTAYREEAARKSDLLRTDLQKEKTGVFTGAYAINPVNGEQVPVWIADYVLATYGTGAIMSVPGHDERDWEFAKTFNLPIIEVISGGNVDEASYSGDGILVNSGLLNGMDVKTAKKTIVAWLEERGQGKGAVNYKLRDWLFSRQRYWGEPIPIILCDHCGFVPVPDEALPLQLPDVEAYEPTDSGESPLANMTDWVEVNCPSCGGKAKRETDTMPNWAGSSWYFLRYCDPHNNDALADPEKLKYWMPVDLYNGGMEHTTLHLLYSRFWYKFLWDLGIVPEACGNEPYARRRSHGLILAEGGEKMSKSKGNVVNPDDVVQEYGADVFRMYEMFMGPFDQPVPWDTNGIEGVKRFLDRVWFIYNPEEAMTLGDSRFGKEVFEGTKEQDPAFPEVLFHQTIKKISLGIDQMQLNTCVSQLMLLSRELVGPLEKFSLEYKEIFLQLLAPFAPHLAEELWFQMGKTESIHLSGWPKYDEGKLQAATFELVVQVNGKVRAKFEVSSDISEEDAKARALASEQVKTYLAGKVPKKVIYVLGKLVSIVV